MFLKDHVSPHHLSLAVALCLFLSSSGQAQQRQPAAEQEDEVVRITTELVQTDVAVFDRQGRFVDGLRPEQFELQVNGRPQAITFFERVRAGSRSKEAQLAAAALRGSKPVISTQPFQVPPAADPARLPFWSELSLGQLTPGRYVLQLTATDRTTNRTAVERVAFNVV